MVLELKIVGDHFHHKVHEHLASWSLLKLDMFVFQLFWLWVGSKNGTSCMLTMFLWTISSHMAWIFAIQTKIISALMLFFLFCEGDKLSLIDLHGIVFWCR